MAFQDPDLVAQHQQLGLISGAVAKRCEGEVNEEPEAGVKDEEEHGRRLIVAGLGGSPLSSDGLSAPHTLRMISGNWTEDFLSHLNFDVAFVSAAGLTQERGLTTLRHSLSGTLNAARAVSQRTIALIDSSKIGRDSLLTVFGPRDVEIIVDDGIPPNVLEQFRRTGMRVVVAESSASP